MLISSRSVYKQGLHRPFLFLVGWFLKKSSPLKPLGLMNRNLVGSILGRSSIKIAHLVPIRLQTWPPQAILVSGWSISKNLLLCNCLAKWTETWWEAPMEGSVLSFLKAEWKVSDTSSAHWASSYKFKYLQVIPFSQPNTREITPIKTIKKHIFL